MIEEYTDPLERFGDELDALIRHWQDKPEDDRLTGGEIVGALEFRKHTIIQEIIRRYEEGCP